MVEKHNFYLDEWNRIHCSIVAENPKPSAEERNSRMADYCEKMILKAKETYYNNPDEMIMEDFTYDWFEDRLKILRPNSKILEKVGA